MLVRLGVARLGISEIVRSGETGLLVAPLDVPALTRAMLELLALPERAERMGSAAASAARTGPTWDQHVAAYLALYQELAR